MLRIALSSLCLLLPVAVCTAEETVEFNRDIRPIFVDTCFACHGADSSSRKADLRIDLRDAAIAAKAIVPGDLKASGMIERIFSDDPETLMPPPNSHKKLTAAQKELLKKWVASGAEYQPHWAFIAPKRPTPPLVKNAAWVKNPIDQFVLAKLESLKLVPAEEADRRTLARRTSLDITGLPPDPAEVEKFVADPSPDAYEKWIDRLLTSKQWGEHRGRYWLDAARYADTHGIHFDNYREMWSYRDWVINAFNADMPFDQFTIEQLAGDMLPEASVDQQVASGFNRCNMTTNEGGIIDEEYLVLYTRDRTETVSQVWLGLTAGCAVCHDHKFDPLSQREFYETAAFFNNTTQPARDGNIKDSPPIIMLPKPENRERWNAIGAEIAAAKKQAADRRQAARAEFETWSTSANTESIGKNVPREGLYLQASLKEGQGKTIKISIDGADRDVPLSDKATWQDGPYGDKALQSQGTAAELADVGDFESSQAFTCSVWIKTSPNDGQGAIAARMDDANAFRGWDLWMQQRRPGMHIINTWPDNALKVVAKNQLPAKKWTHLTVAYDGSGKAAGVKVYYDGVSQPTNVEADKLQKDTIRTGVPFKIGQRHTTSPLSGASLQDLRIYKRALNAGEIETLAKNSQLASILEKPAASRSAKDKDELFNWWLQTSDGSFRELTQKVSSLEQEQATIKAGGTVAHVMNERNAEPGAFILNRGEYDQRRDPVKPNTPAVLPAFPADLPRNRLGYAKWLLLPEQPLTARVTVNRFWQEVFGAGIVRTTGDFGTAADLPSNQALLDWLAVDFRESGWNVKRFFKQIFLSNTYRQAAITTPDKLRLDPANRFFSRGPRFRMDAEMVRDYALASSGILVPKIGGPSVKPYQPEGVWEAVAMNVSNTRSYQRDTGEGLYRRSLYTFWKRAAPPASMDVFNAPNREICTVRRDRTNTPLQALVTLNDPQFIEAARYLSQRAMQDEASSDEKRLDYIARRILSRPLRAEEAGVLTASLKELKDYYQSHLDDAKKLITVGESKPDAALDAASLAAWTMLTNEVMNLDEVLNK